MTRGFLEYTKSMLKERPHWLIPGVGGAGLYQKCSVLGKARKELPMETRKYSVLAVALFEGCRLGLPMIFPAIHYASTGQAIPAAYWAAAGISYFGFTAVFSEIGKIIDSDTLEAKLGNNSTVA